MKFFVVYDINVTQRVLKLNINCFPRNMRGLILFLQTFYELVKLRLFDR